MKNMKMSIEKKILTITVDLGKTFGDSKSGKTTIVATSEGNQDVPGHKGMKIGLNIYKRKDEEDEE